MATRTAKPTVDAGLMAPSGIMADVPEGIRYGYARVSTKRQELQLQLDALNAAGCTTIFSDKLSGKNTARPEFQRLIKLVKAGDMIVVYKTDRFGRSTTDVINIVYELGKRGVGFKSTTEPSIDTTTAMGRFVFTVFAALAELDNDIRRQRIKDGIAASTNRNGRPPAMVTLAKTDKLSDVLDLLAQPKMTVARVSRLTGVPKRTLFRHMDALRAAAK